MAFVPAPNIVQVELRQTLAGQKIENRFMIDNLGTPTEAELLGYATLAWDWWENTLSPSIATAVTLNSAVATDMGTLNGAQVTYAPDTTTTGGESGTAMPNEVAICVTLSSGLRGRSARGRMYLAGIPSTARADANNITNAAAETYRSAVQTLIDTVEALSRNIVIVSYISEGVPRPGGPVYFTVISAVMKDTLFDSQRRRKPGVGA